MAICWPEDKAQPLCLLPTAPAPLCVQPIGAKTGTYKGRSAAILATHMSVGEHSGPTTASRVCLIPRRLAAPAPKPGSVAAAPARRRSKATWRRSGPRPPATRSEDAANPEADHRGVAEATPALRRPGREA